MSFIVAALDVTALGLSVGMFTVVVVALVGVVLTAKKFLVSSADVQLVIEESNQDTRTIATPAGSTLLNTLAANKIFIPSACGGKGSCGVCKVDVHEGGGEIRGGPGDPVPASASGPKRIRTLPSRTHFGF